MAALAATATGTGALVCSASGSTCAPTIQTIARKTLQAVARAVPVLSELTARNEDEGGTERNPGERPRDAGAEPSQKSLMLAPNRAVSSAARKMVATLKSAP